MPTETCDRTAQTRAHLSEVAELVFLAHAGRPFEVVLTELMLKCETAASLPGYESLPSAAWTISQGRRFVARR
jgi:hypothetical protein